MAFCGISQADRFPWGQANWSAHPRCFLLFCADLGRSFFFFFSWKKSHPKEWSKHGKNVGVMAQMWSVGKQSRPLWVIFLSLTHEKFYTVTKSMDASWAKGTAVDMKYESMVFSSERRSGPGKAHTWLLLPHSHQAQEQRHHCVTGDSIGRYRVTWPSRVQVRTTALAYERDL